MSSFKFTSSIIIWHNFLSKIDIVSKMLQNPKISLAECVHTLKNFQNYIIKKKAMNISIRLLMMPEAEKINIQPEFFIIC